MEALGRPTKHRWVKPYLRMMPRASEASRWFGKESFRQGDALDRREIRRLRDRDRVIGAMYSPPCKFYSTSRFEENCKAPPLIEQTRDAMEEAGWLYAIENVLGASSELKAGATRLRGQWFGLRVDRPRLFETNFELHVDDALREGGERLRARCCLGERRRFRRLDAFGRPVLQDCCAGNTYAVQGDRPWRTTPAACAEAMGVDVAHMGYDRLGLAIPPAYARLVYAQMCMR